MGGEGGTGSKPPEPGEPCEPDGPEKACWSADPRRELVCMEDVWHLGPICRFFERCNPATSQCTPVAPTCLDDPEGSCGFLGDNSLLDCVTDPFAPIERYCPFGCAHGACLPGTGDQLIVHTEVNILWTRGGAWPDDIPVCFADDPGERLKQWTRSAVEQGWARYVDVNFTGWGECQTAGEPAVIVEFLERCRGRLVNAFAPGYPGDAQSVRVGICRSYFDAAGELRYLDDNEAVARFIAQHQFGHVLGLPEDIASQTSTVMRRGIRSMDVAPTVWAHDIHQLQAAPYGYKPAASIVNVSGRCLDATGGAVGLSSCSGSEAERFRALPDRVETHDGRCLVVRGEPPDAVVEIADCSPIPPSNALALRRARWSAPGHCVTPRALPVIPGTVVETRPCTELGDESQTWSFDIVGVASGFAQARIRFAAQDYCLFAAVGNDVPTLEPCSDAHTLFFLGPGGDISLTPPGTGNHACLDWVNPGGVLHFKFCNNRPLLLTGTFETLDGLALSSAPDDPASITVVELARDEAPDLPVVFDVHF